jgi:hypothetical protein
VFTFTIRTAHHGRFKRSAEFLDRTGMLNAVFVAALLLSGPSLLRVCNPLKVEDIVVVLLERCAVEHARPHGADRP